MLSVGSSFGTLSIHPFGREAFIKQAVSSLSTKCSSQNLLGSRLHPSGSLRFALRSAPLGLDPQILARGGDLQAGDGFIRRSRRGGE
jgi:hypothetical protein